VKALSPVEPEGERDGLRNVARIGWRELFRHRASPDDSRTWRTKQERKAAGGERRRLAVQAGLGCRAIGTLPPPVSTRWIAFSHRYEQCSRRSRVIAEETARLFALSLASAAMAPQPQPAPLVP
jgi:hypothetical protein